MIRRNFLKSIVFSGVYLGVQVAKPAQAFLSIIGYEGETTINGSELAIKSLETYQSQEKPLFNAGSVKSTTIGEFEFSIGKGVNEDEYKILVEHTNSSISRQKSNMSESESLEMICTLENNGTNSFLTLSRLTEKIRDVNLTNDMDRSEIDVTYIVTEKFFTQGNNGIPNASVVKNIHFGADTYTISKYADNLPPVYTRLANSLFQDAFVNFE